MGMSIFHYFEISYPIHPVLQYPLVLLVMAVALPGTNPLSPITPIGSDVIKYFSLPLTSATALMPLIDAIKKSISQYFLLQF